MHLAPIVALLYCCWDVAARLRGVPVALLASPKALRPSMFSKPLLDDRHTTAGCANLPAVPPVKNGHDGNRAANGLSPESRFIESRDLVVAGEGFQEAIVPVVLDLPGGVRRALLLVLKVILRILRVGRSGCVAETLLVSCLRQHVEHLAHGDEHLQPTYKRGRLFQVRAAMPTWKAKRTSVEIPMRSFLKEFKKSVEVYTYHHGYHGPVLR